MTGAWAREADSVVLTDWERLDRAALALTYALTEDVKGRTFWLTNASAIIRRERKALDASAPRIPDFSSYYATEHLMWIALELVSEIGSHYLTPLQRAYCLREAEAALRTIHKRGRA